MKLKRLPQTIIMNSSRRRLFFLIGHTHTLALSIVSGWRDGGGGYGTMYLCCMYRSRLALSPTPRTVVDLTDNPLHPFLKAFACLGRGRLNEPRAVSDGVQVQPLRDLRE